MTAVRPLRLAAFVFALAVHAAPLAAQERAPAVLASDAVATPPGLPAIGKWMIDRDGAVAHWLGERLGGNASKCRLRIKPEVPVASPEKETRRAFRAARPQSGGVLCPPYQCQ